ncbi:Threonine--tRNA ligase [Buchnera aphidicola (Eriosoma grossulariae)]|uniref:threonine--tRNA ligase n=1 Tax=Buchnera aphidicola TaxID=9 RepID=UPI003463C31A
MPVIYFSDGNQYISDHPVSLLKVIEHNYPKILNNCVGASIDNMLFDLNTIIKKNCLVQFIREKDILALNIINNSCVYLLGYAIKILWPESQLGQGGVVNNRFYYDFDLNNNITKHDLKLIEHKMLDLSKYEFNILNKYVSIKEAIKIFTILNEQYKLKLLSQKLNTENKILLYYHKNYTDFDIGIQLPNIRFCRYFKLETLSGAYWNSKKSNKMLYRVYGVVWLNKNQLTENINRLKLIKERDHRIISKNLSFYHMQEDAPGMVFWHPNGLILFQLIKQFIRLKLLEYNYHEVKTPIIMDQKIWEKSGHWDNYQESIFTTSSENRKYCIKPMNCPGHLQIFNQGLRSYRDLPYRMAEFGSCHRQEPSGSLHGLMRVRAFTQDDAHIFCTEEQISTEIDICIKMIFNIYNTFGFKKILIKLSTRPEKSIGSTEIWDRAEKDLVHVLNKNNLNFEYQPGEGAFYGPKIELILEDSLNRTWQCGTIQLDFYLSQRLNTFYINKYNERQFPIIIHRAVLGSLERFIGILIEEYSGNFPLWLAPIQVVVININKNHIDYVKKITNILLKIGIRVQLDIRNEKINVKIREYTILRIPYIFICGQKELEESSITIRNRSGKSFKIDDINFIIKKLQFEINTRSFSQMEE